MELRYHPLEDEVSKKVQKACQRAMPAGEEIVSPPGVVLPGTYKNYAQRILDLEVREDDIWVISFPKCGEIFLIFINLTSCNLFLFRY